jgi:hypothetical protein
MGMNENVVESDRLAKAVNGGTPIPEKERRPAFVWRHQVRRPPPQAAQKWTCPDYEKGECCRHEISPEWNDGGPPLLRRSAHLRNDVCEPGEKACRSLARGNGQPGSEANGAGRPLTGTRARLRS